MDQKLALNSFASKMNEISWSRGLVVSLWVNVGDGGENSFASWERKVGSR